MLNKLTLNKNVLRASLNKTQLTQMPKRFDGSYPWFTPMVDKIPRANATVSTEFLDESEVITRMLFILNNFAIYDLKTLDWSKNFSDNGIDSLESTAILTSFEHEFHTIFEDRVFENFENLNEVKNFIVTDHNCF
mmetsp:Transcript_21214/g.15228  ORF Transcript_21214/g.15228 Transcript_21214/m.15228 type:complete len:135 (+) Transcript_21214:26-430(+)|eukprot:CAMPEP_0116886486 /NCGR_PEP_ID=MMETSP0463-20121206/20368_1 /TAXON_ID=181622 /ORGANISM="Strombidinopsis sp, Strain SopsisLIS2011" /LENGTH=134 /DNA_ID=CAMNT_0004547019 /DNA_START=18 /DNA_END=422 /DNA_ORIENTATION=+